MSMKNPLTPAGIEPETFRFEAQHLKNGEGTYSSELPDVISVLFAQREEVTPEM